MLVSESYNEIFTNIPELVVINPLIAGLQFKNTRNLLDFHISVKGTDSKLLIQPEGSCKRVIVQPSSEVFKDGLKLMQMHQIATVINGIDALIIHEILVTWNPTQTSMADIKLVGKECILSAVVQKVPLQFFTEVDPETKEISCTSTIFSGEYIKFKNHQPYEFKFKNETSYSTYHKFQEGKKLKALHVSVKLTDEVREGMNEVHKNMILESTIDVILNMVPIDVDKNKRTPQEFRENSNWLQPREDLGGHSISELLLFDPNNSNSSILTLDYINQTTKETLLDQINAEGSEAKASLKAKPLEF
jgi:hypothetical protein